jgi:hypothetical protein
MITDDAAFEYRLAKLTIECKFRERQPLRLSSGVACCSFFYVRLFGSLLISHIRFVVE